MRTQLHDLVDELKEVRRSIRLCEYEEATNTPFHKWLINKEEMIVSTIINIQ